MSAARGFFEREIPGIYSWDDVEKRPAEPSDPDPETGKVNPREKFKERVVLVFDEFRLEVDTCQQVPPLGSVKLFTDNELRADGPLDVSTWAKIGSAIRERCNVST